MIRTFTLERIRLVRFPDDWTRWIVAVLFAGLAIQSARLLWALVVPVGPLGDWRQAMPVPMSAQAQAAVLASVNVFGGATPAAAAVSALPSDLKLFGVRAAFGSLRGGAIIQLPDGQQVSVSVGESVMPGIELVAVAFDHVDIVRNGGRQRLFLDPDKAPQALSPGASPGATPPAASGAAGLAAAVSLAPRASASGISGIIVSPGANAAAFARTGLRSGDVIVSVNGVSITSAEDLAQLRQSLSTPGSLSLRVERGGSIIPVTLNSASNQ